MPKHHAVARVLMITLMAAASGSVHGMTGDGQETTPSSTASKDSTTSPESPTRVGVPPVAREYKGKLDQVGPFSLRDLDGRVRTERDFIGRVLIAVQWAAWCGPCVSEFPQVQKLYNTYRRDPSIALVSLDLDKDPATLDKFLGEFRQEYSFPVLFAGARYKISALPCTWIVDREGYVREVLRGSGVGWLEQVQGLAEAVKHRPRVSSLPPETRKAQHEENEREGATSR